jgi:hypothetical protein
METVEVSFLPQMCGVRVGKPKNLEQGTVMMIASSAGKVAIDLNLLLVFCDFQFTTASGYICDSRLNCSNSAWRGGPPSVYGDVYLGKTFLSNCSSSRH